MLALVLDEVREVLHGVVAVVALVALLRAVKGKVDFVLLALLEGARAFMALVALLLHAAVL